MWFFLWVSATSGVPNGLVGIPDVTLTDQFLSSLIPCVTQAPKQPFTCLDPVFDKVRFASEQICPSKSVWRHRTQFLPDEMYTQSSLHCHLTQSYIVYHDTFSLAISSPSKEPEGRWVIHIFSIHPIVTTVHKTQLRHGPEKLLKMGWNSQIRWMDKVKINPTWCKKVYTHIIESISRDENIYLYPLIMMYNYFNVFWSSLGGWRHPVP